MRGFLSGIFWGLGVAVVGLSTASLIAPQPAGNRPPEAPLVEPPATAPAGPEAADAPAAEVTAPAAQDGPDVAGVAAPAVPEGAGRLPAADTAPAGVPALAEPATGLVAPTVAGEDTAAGALDSGAEGAPGGVPAVAEAPSPAPLVPAPEADVVAATEPAAPQVAEAEPVAEAGEDAVSEAPAAIVVVDDRPEAEPVVAPETAAARLPVAGVDDPAQPDDVTVAQDAPGIAVDVAPAPVAAGPDPVTAILAPAADVAAAPAEPSRPEAEPLAEPEVEPIVDPEAEPLAEPEAEPLAEPIAEPEVEPLADPAESGIGQDVAEAPAEPVLPGLPESGETGLDLPQVGAEPEVAEVTPDEGSASAEDVALPGENGEPRLPGGESGVRVNRPTAGDAAGDAAVVEPDATAVPALARYAASREVASGLPQMGIVLVDDGSLAGAVAVVAALPVPVTVAIDPGGPGAAETMAAYRAAGIEVLALSRLPVGAAPTDVAVTFEAIFALLPEAIGVIDTGDGGLQENSAVTDQAMARLAADGRGAVVPGGGLNMAARAAAGAGVPLVTIDRALDAQDEDAAAVRRLLDQAAFRARQQSGVVLLGRVRAETVSALMLWGAAMATDEVDVAPVSAILLAAE